MAMDDYNVDVLTQVDQMRAAGSDWDRLAGGEGSPLLGSDWFVACAETFSAQSNLRVVVVRLRGVICAVAPLVVVKRDGTEWLEVLGTSVLYEPTGFLYSGLEPLQQLVSKIVSFRMPVMLARIPAESPLEATFRKLSRLGGVLLARRAASAAYVSSGGKWEDYFPSISAQRRYDYQRKRKRMERIGQVAVRIERPTSPAELPHLLEEVFRIEGAGWKGRAGSALLSNEPVRKFIARYSEMALAKGALRVCFLDVQGVPIATILGVEQGHRFWVLKIGYDEQWSRCSPGVQITMETIRYAFDHRLEAYEFLGSEEPWQAMWPRSRHDLISLVLYPISLRGGWAFGGDVRRFIKQKVAHVLAN